MPRLILLMLCLCILEKVMASEKEEFAAPLKPHQLMSRISGVHLRDPRDGFETFMEASKRLENVLEQNVPAATQDVDDLFARDVLKLGVVVLSVCKAALNADHKALLVQVVKDYRERKGKYEDRGTVFDRKVVFKHTSAYPWYAVALIRDLNILDPEDVNPAALWQQAMETHGCSLDVLYRGYYDSQRLVYAESMYALVQKHVFGSAIQHQVFKACPAYEEDGQFESLHRGANVTQATGALEIVPELEFRMVVVKGQNQEDTLAAYIKGYAAVAGIHNIEKEILTQTLEKHSPYPLSKAEKAYIDETFSKMSKERLEVELVNFPLVLQHLKTLAPFKVRYVDLLCCERQIIVKFARQECLHRLGEIWKLIQEKEILAAIRKNLSGK